MTLKPAKIDFGTIQATADVAAQLVCLKCRSTFWSEVFDERICTHCKGTVAVRSAIHEDSGHGRRRFGGRPS